MPALLLLCSGYAIPTLRILWTSLQHVTFLKQSNARFAGLDNYMALDNVFGAGTLMTFGVGLASAVIAIVGGGAVAYLAHRSGRSGRRAVQIAYAVPMASLASAAIATAWLHTFARRPVNAFPDALDPGYAIVALLVSFGLLTGLGATAYLLVLRAGGPPRRLVPAGVLVAVVLAAGAVAVTLQSFVLPNMLLRKADSTPAIGMYNAGFRYGDLGLASAAGVVLLAVLAVLGVIVTAVVVLLRARIVRVEEPGPAKPSGAWLAATAVVGGGALLIGVLGLLPWLGGLADFGRLPGGWFTPILFTWGPTLVSTVVGVGAAVLAGYGIGALRPFGDRSALLLLPFAPWLFVGLVPLMTDAYMHLWDGDDNVAKAFLRAIPPSSLSIPALFLSAVLFRGLASQYGPSQALRRAAPVVGLIALVTWVVQAQDPLWSLVVTRDRDYASMPSLALNQMFQYAVGPETLVGWVLPVPGFLLLAAAIAAVQVFSIDKLALRVGADDTPQPPA